MSLNEKQARFRRLAEKRTNTVIKKIQVLSNCSNKSMYSYTADEINSIFGAIENELKSAKALFKVKIRETSEFKLKK